MTSICSVAFTSRHAVCGIVHGLRSATVSASQPRRQPPIMGCPHLENLLEGAVSGCPFLRELAERHGASYAQQIAVQPSRTATCGSAPVLEEGMDGFYTTLALFHGAAGVVPLARFQHARQGAGLPSEATGTPGCMSSCTSPHGCLKGRSVTPLHSVQVQMVVQSAPTPIRAKPRAGT